MSSESKWMILTVARTALLLLLAVKGKSVPLLGVQMPFMVQTVCVRTIIFLRFLKTHHITFCNKINCYLLKTDDIKKTLTGRWDSVKGLSSINYLVFMLIVLEPCDSSTCSWKIYHMLPGVGGVHRISSDGDDRMGAKIKTPKKSLGLLTKPQKIPGPEINPPKNPMQNYTAGIRGHYHESSDCFEYPKKSLLKSSHPKKYLPNFPTQKNPRIENFKPKKILPSSSSLEISPHPPPPPSRIRMFFLPNHIFF